MAAETMSSMMRCARCKGYLVAHGVEPHRYVCEACGQNYHLVMQLVPVEPLRQPVVLALPEPKRVE